MKDKMKKHNNGTPDKDPDGLDTMAFLKIADKFINVANRENKRIEATDLHMAFLYAAARYNAYVANAIIKVDNHEEFVKHMVGQYTDMLRQHLADENIARQSKGK